MYVAKARRAKKNASGYIQPLKLQERFQYCSAQRQHQRILSVFASPPLSLPNYTCVGTTRKSAEASIADVKEEPLPPNSEQHQTRCEENGKREANPKTFYLLKFHCSKNSDWEAD